MDIQQRYELNLLRAGAWEAKCEARDLARRLGNNAKEVTRLLDKAEYWEAEAINREAECAHATAGETEIPCALCLHIDMDDAPTPVDQDQTSVQHHHIFVCKNCGRRETRVVIIEVVK